MPSDKAVFVCSCGDMTFSTKGFVQKVLQAMRRDRRKGRVFFLQSKNPACLKQYLNLIPQNTYLLTTLETNRDVGYSNFSAAPLPSQRYKDFLSLNWDKKIVTVEPIMDFDLDPFARMIVSINPEAVFIGYNSGQNRYPVPEPTWKQTVALWRAIRGKGIKVLPKEKRRNYIPKYAYRDLLPPQK
jgi:hypothetical protein